MWDIRICQKTCDIELTEAITSRQRLRGGDDKLQLRMKLPDETTVLYGKCNLRITCDQSCAPSAVRPVLARCVPRVIKH